MVGGRIAVTDRAVIFEPNWLDWLLLARGRRVPRASIAQVGRLVGRGDPFVHPHRGRHDRVRIEVRNASDMIVAVRDPTRLVSLLD
jgi:hypothetical protein